MIETLLIRLTIEIFLMNTRVSSIFLPQCEPDQLFIIYLHITFSDREYPISNVTYFSKNQRSSGSFIIHPIFSLIF